MKTFILILSIAFSFALAYNIITYNDESAGFILIFCSLIIILWCAEYEIERKNLFLYKGKASKAANELCDHIINSQKDQVALERERIIEIIRNHNNRIDRKEKLIEKLK